MDAYPEDYLVHNLPLILLSGLETNAKDESGSTADDVNYPLLREKGYHIYSDFPAVSGHAAEELRNALLEKDASQAPWISRTDALGRPAATGVKIKSVGRSYRLPPRKADPPPTSPISPAIDDDEDDDDGARRRPFVLHSPISPLTPSSPTFPDGLLTPLWVAKHQKLVPAAVVNFFPFTLDRNMSSLRDNQLKIEINGLKKDWSSSGYKSRFLVVLLSENGENPYLGDADDRITSIRRATNLDQKSIFLLPSDVTSVELKEFAVSFLSMLQPWIAEYYRDLSKHARRKRNRSTIPPPTAPPTTGTSRTLSLHDWNVRYEFKLGIFAEFRQEMDAAYRNYESAYEYLFGQEVFENIAGWSPRFNDARLLADSLAIRIIRCLLWTGQTTAAVRAWTSHRSHSQDIVNRRGKGTKNYGWEAWESRWSMVMSQLISRADIPFLSHSIFIPPEKTLPAGEPIDPWELLHHEGYWLDRSAKHTSRRRKLAQQIPDEDRIPLAQSPASQIASKSYLYDTYLAPETHVEAPSAGQSGFNHSQLIIDTLQASLAEFSKRHQVRKVESLSLEIAEEYMRLGSWSEAYDILRPMWLTLSWRHSGWWHLMVRFGRALRECALRIHDSETIIRVDWELLNKVFHMRTGWHNHDLHRSLESLPLEKPKPSISLKAEDTVACLTGSVVFEKSEGNVGEPLQLQLAISSLSHASSKPIRLSGVKIVFEGCLRPINLQSDENVAADTTTPCSMATPLLHESNSLKDPSLIHSPTSNISALNGITDLAIGPSQTKVINLACIPRESGEARVTSITMIIEEQKFDLAYSIMSQDRFNCFWWRQTENGMNRKRIGKDRDPTSCTILPKPPKIRITTPNLRENYYSNERVVLNVDVHNDESEAADVTLAIRLFGHPDAGTKVSWLDEEGIEKTQNDQNDLDDPTFEETSHFIRRRVGVMDCSSKKELQVVLTNTNDASDYELEILADYHLVFDVQTPIAKSVTVDLSFIRPFEANYEFLTRLHPQRWPNFFQIDDRLLGDGPEPKPGGLVQRWCLSSKVVSFALEPLIIEDMSLTMLDLKGDAVCNIGKESAEKPQTPEVSPEELREANFIVDIQKNVLGDRRPTTLDLALDIRWRRREADTSTIFTLAIPRFLVPMGEPRVLAAASSSRTLSGLIHLDYTIENPSMHFLTFSLTMEASEQFAFSGPKTTVVQLVPLSRHTVRYNLLATQQGLWIQPQLVVVDTFFNKTLRVLPTENMRSNKKGILVWVDADD